MTMVCLLATLLPSLTMAPDLLAQQWRGRIATRWQFLDARPLVLDSVPVAAATTLANRS